MTFVKFLHNADYENKDGGWTRFPDQLYIETIQEKQSAQDVLILQLQAALAASQQETRDALGVVEAAREHLEGFRRIYGIVRVRVRNGEAFINDGAYNEVLAALAALPPAPAEGE